MEKFKKLSLTAASVVLSLIAINAFACCSNVEAYRTYYLDRHCNYYYNQGCSRVTDGQYVSQNGSALSLKRDCHGRWYREDMLGNKMYVVARCEYPCGVRCHRLWK